MSAAHDLLPGPAPSVALRWPAWVLLALCVLVPYLPNALGADFLRTFDDNFYFGPDNPEFQAGLGAVLDPGQPIANVYLPVAHASLWLDYWLAGGSAWWPHLVALGWHLVAGVVLVRLLRAVGLAPAPALAAAVLFVLHPALAESVAWVSGRKDLLSAVGVGLALLAARRHAESGRPALLLGAALCQGLAMYAKATAVVAPLLAVLVVAGARGRSRWLAPLVLLLVTVPIAWHHQTLAAAQGTLAAAALGERLGQVPGAYLHYLATACWPADLNVLYPEVATLERFRANPGRDLLWLGGVLAVAGAALAGRRSRLCGAGLLAFGVALLPFNTAFPASSIAAADRYLYLAVPGLTAAVAAALWALLPGRAAALVVVGLALPLAHATGARAGAFRDDATLWRTSLATDPDNAVAHLNLVHTMLHGGPAELGAVRSHLDAAVAAARYPVHTLRAAQLAARVALVDADYAAAARHARAAIAAGTELVAQETNPARQAQAKALLVAAQLAAIEPLRLAKDPAGAAEAWRSAQALVPDHPEVVAFASLRALEGLVAGLQASAAAGGATRLADDDPRVVAALARLDAALQDHPQAACLQLAKAEWYRAADRAFLALHAYRQAVAAEPDRIDGWLGAARLLRERDQFADAADYARQGLARRQDPALLQELALALVGLGRLDDAVAQLEACLRIAPDDPELGKVLANVLVVQAYARLGKQEASHAQVLAAVERALQLNPKEAKAHLVVGLVRREQRRYAEAVDQLERAHRLLPDFAEAKEKLVASLLDLGLERRLAGDEPAALAAWLRARELAPAAIPGTAVELYLQAIWRNTEQRGVAALGSGDLAAAEAAFRTCLRIDAQQHWPAWLLAQTLLRSERPDLAEVERLARRAIDGQRQHGLECSRQVHLLAVCLVQAGRRDDARQVAREYLAAPDAEAAPAALAALREIVNG